jgi:CHAT domain-containing protein
VLHFATHGLMPGELSCLQEATIIASPTPGAPNASNALLTAGVVLELELDADVVILSACNSGGGSAGESLSSLARSIFYAGARSLMVTHWYLNDAAATRIIAFSLRNLQQGQGMAEALRNAQLDLARNVPGGGHPALWGAFALVGPGPSARASMAGVAGAPTSRN